ncbi:hypothetical protein [Burkholderia sp. LMG 13014]|uniref:hypothetical protein n=1 Tax=Burkholderia sp. LMG 13014 TaxID=2709306 RepID=UPI001964CBDC|nr:hypothetical protein [Burkholderia sp. LMG 13014]
MNCKPRDLAYVVRSDFDENLGAVVEVIGNGFMDRGDWTWECESKRVIRCYDCRNRSSALVPPGTPFTVPDAWLRPISGVPMTEDVSDEVTA